MSRMPIGHVTYANIHVLSLRLLHNLIWCSYPCPRTKLAIPMYSQEIGHTVYCRKLAIPGDSQEIGHTSVLAGSLPYPWIRRKLAIPVDSQEIGHTRVLAVNWLYPWTRRKITIPVDSQENYYTRVLAEKWFLGTNIRARIKSSIMNDSFNSVSPCSIILSTRFPPPVPPPLTLHWGSVRVVIVAREQHEPEMSWKASEIGNNPSWRRSVEDLPKLGEGGRHR